MKTISYTISSMKRHKYRYIACIIGLSVAVGSIFTMASFTDSLDRTVNQFFLIEQDTILVTSKGTSIIQIIPFSSTVPEDVIEPIYDLSGVATVLPLIFKQYSNTTSAEWLNDVIVGIGNDILDIYISGIKLAKGRKAQTNSNEIIIGPKVKDGDLNLGDTIFIMNKNFTVVGILESNNILFDHFIYMEYGEAQKLYQMEGYCTLLYVIGNEEYFKNQQNIIELTTNIKNIDNTIDATSSESLKEESNNFFEALKFLQNLMTMIPFTISLMFVFLLMMLNVKDQQKEFGILKAIGASDKQIFLNIFIQSMLLIVFGLILGIFVGFLFFSLSFGQLDTISTTFSDTWSYALSMTQSIPTIIYLRTIISALICGFIVSVYPSILASKTNIVKSIRKIG